MRAREYVVALSEDERARVERVARSHRRSARERLHARIVLRADSAAEGGARPDAGIAEELHSCVNTVGRVRRRCAQAGWKAAVYRQAQAHRKARVLDGAGEAHLIAVACGDPPEGHKRWSLMLLKQRLIELHIVDTISHETVRRTLKKTSSSLG